MPKHAPSSTPADWVDTHGDALFRYALLRLRDRTAAEDAVQETLLAALRSRSGFAGESSERTWLIGILKHKIADHWRRLGREAPLDLPADADESDALIDKLFDAADDYHWRLTPAPWTDPDESLEDKQFWKVLTGCLGELPPAQAQAFTLCEIDGSDGAEACKVLNISATNLWVMLHRARLRLRQCLERNWFGTETE